MKILDTKNMTAKELRKKYLEFFESHGHSVIPSAPVVPENDPTVLFTTAGMHPLVPYLMGEIHPLGKRLVNSQKCIRTGDIDDVGDNRHLTFFEMLGNWSLGDYFKREAIEWSWKFMTSPDWLGLDPKRIYVTVFAGDDASGVSCDDESIGLWREQYKKIGMKAGVCELDGRAEKDSRIFLLGKDDNFWGPAGETGPCGPCTEMFYDVRPEEGELKGTHDELVKSFRLMEVWNDVFMEFNKTAIGKYEKMAQQNVDTGMGLERTITVMTGKENVFDTDLFLPIVSKIEELSGKKYEDEKNKKPMRIVADHIKAAVFMVADGVAPSNVQRGYVLRRLIRRAVRQGHILGIENNFISEVAKVVREMYGEVYPEVADGNILKVLEEEENKFRKTLEGGIKALKKFFGRAIEGVDPENLPKGMRIEGNKIRVDGKEVFHVYETYGFPIEMSQEIMTDWGVKFDEQTIQEAKDAFESHQELSRTASAGMFKGGLADAKEKTMQLHTSAHLMLAGLRKVLGEDVHQKGSNINGERIRFDFSYSEKMTSEQKRLGEEFVNEAISAKLDVTMEEMTLGEAREAGAEGAFENKYGERVKVYSIPGFSKEICGGPHVKNTGEIIGKFKIRKEESSSAGVRRIKATVE
jgi:alanyl-tRNA synthetase